MGSSGCKELERLARLVAVRAAGIQIWSHGRPGCRVPVCIEWSRHVLQRATDQLLFIMTEEELSIRAQLQWLFVRSHRHKVELACRHLRSVVCRVHRPMA